MVRGDRYVSIMDRMASAPISWGVCEVPGWGVELPPERVLSEMSQLGFTATELGSPGYFPDDPAALRDLVEGEHNLAMIGGFVPVVIHDPSQENATIDATHEAARLMSGAGGHLFISAAVTDWDWGPRPDIDAAGWQQAAKMLGIIDEIIAEYDMVQALHPHLGTVVESADDIDRVLNVSEVGWTLDMGHMLIGGTDPVAFASDAFDRVRHVHLKDVVLDLAAPVFAGEQSIMEGVQNGMFSNIGQGDVPVAEVITTLEAAGFDQWYVVEQDAAITGEIPPAGDGPFLDVQKSIEYLRAVETDLLRAGQPGSKEIPEEGT